MRMRDVLWQIWLNCGYFLTVAASGFFLYKLCAPFVRPRNGRFWRVLLFLTLAGSTGMVIWIGDPNLLYTLPAFFALFLLSTRGDRIGRVAVCIILFCLEMSVCALLDTYVERINRNALYDVLVRLARPLVFGPLWLLLRRRLPREPVVLSRRLWKLVLGLAAMPLCALPIRQQKRGPLRASFLWQPESRALRSCKTPSAVPCYNGGIVPSGTRTISTTFSWKEEAG